MWYLLKRGFQMIVILVILSIALFGLLSAMPGNPVDMLITSNPRIKPEDVIRLRKLRGLDKPWTVQYVRWLWGYHDPQRPPQIATIDPLTITADEKGQATAVFDVSSYLTDPNFSMPPEEITRLLNQVWPAWKKEAPTKDILWATESANMTEVLRLLGQVKPSEKNRLVSLMEQKWLEGIKVQGLLGSNADGFALTQTFSKPGFYRLWFLATNASGQEAVSFIKVHVQPKTQIVEMPSHDLLTLPIASQVVDDESKPFRLDLAQFVNDPQTPVEFALKKGMPGTLSKRGIYEHHFAKAGQSVISFLAKNERGQIQEAAFAVEHGVIAHPDRFNRGFLFFFTGDRNALGFSQTYKRPVYDLLFGDPVVCGDGVVGPGETCDDSVLSPDSPCTKDCQQKSASILSIFNAKLSGFLVSSSRIGNTLQLMIPALILSLLIAIPLGVFGAYRQYSKLDYILNFSAFIGISMPVFWFGIMMMFLFAEYLQWLPAGGIQTPDIYSEGALSILKDKWRHALLPTTVLGIYFIGRWLRYMRASMLEILPKDYIRTARAKGLSERVVVLKHAFRNALIPVVTVLALSIPTLFGGAVLTETVFSWPGIGRLQYEAVISSDYYVAIVVFLIEAILVMAANLVADAVYVLVDPRMRSNNTWKA